MYLQKNSRVLGVCIIIINAYKYSQFAWLSIPPPLFRLWRLSRQKNKINVLVWPFNTFDKASFYLILSTKLPKKWSLWIFNKIHAIKFSEKYFKSYWKENSLLFIAIFLHNGSYRVILLLARLSKQCFCCILTWFSLASVKRTFYIVPKHDY